MRRISMSSWPRRASWRAEPRRRVVGRRSTDRRRLHPPRATGRAARTVRSSSSRRAPSRAAAATPAWLADVLVRALGPATRARSRLIVARQRHLHRPTATRPCPDARRGLSGRTIAHAADDCSNGCARGGMSPPTLDEAGAPISAREGDGARRRAGSSSPTDRLPVRCLAGHRRRASSHASPTAGPPPSRSCARCSRRHRKYAVPSWRSSTRPAITRRNGDVRELGPQERSLREPDAGRGRHLAGDPRRQPEADRTSTRAGPSGVTTSIPTPRLNVARITSSAIAPCSAIHSNTGGTLPRLDRSTSRAEPVGHDAREVVGDARRR